MNHAMTMNTAAHISGAAAPDDLFSPVPPSNVLDGTAHEFLEFANEQVEMLEGLLKTARLVQTMVTKYTNGSLTSREAEAFMYFESATLRLNEAVNGPTGSIEVRGITHASLIERIIYSLQHEMVSQATALLEDYD